MGPQWTPWMALREFACNAIDEGGYVIEETDSENPEAGFTKVYINMLPAVEDFWKYRQKYLETEKPYQTINVPDGDIVHFHNHNTEGKPGKRVIYRKGVRCSPLEDSQQSLFRYDIPALKIGENRLFESEWTMSRTIAEAYYACSDLDILKKLLKIATDKSYFEGNISWPNSGYHMDTAWEVLLMDEKIISQAHCPFLPPEDIRSGFVVPDGIYNNLKSQFPNLTFIDEPTRFTIIEGTEKQRERLLKAVEEVQSFGLNPPGVEYGIGRFKEKEILGVYHKGKVYISEALVDKPDQDYGLIEVVFEETTHHEGYRDGSRAFEQQLIKMLVKAYRKGIEVEELQEQAS